MGTYFAYVNHTRKERVDLDSLWGEDHGDPKEHSVVLWGGVIAYLMFPGGMQVTGFRGRWGSLPKRGIDQRFEISSTISDAQAVAIVADADVDWEELDKAGYIDITGDLVADMKRTGFWRCTAPQIAATE
jgi:hypothetical protein